MRIKKLIALTLTAALMTVTIGCNKTETGNTGAETETKSSLIGVAMPTPSLQSWNQDGAKMK